MRLQIQKDDAGAEYVLLGPVESKRCVFVKPVRTIFEGFDYWACIETDDGPFEIIEFIEIANAIGWVFHSAARSADRKSSLHDQLQKFDNTKTWLFFQWPGGT